MQKMNALWGLAQALNLEMDKSHQSELEVYIRWMKLRNKLVD